MRYFLGHQKPMCSRVVAHGNACSKLNSTDISWILFRRPFRTTRNSWPTMLDQILEYSISTVFFPPHLDNAHSGILSRIRHTIACLTRLQTVVADLHIAYSVRYENGDNIQLFCFTVKMKRPNLILRWLVVLPHTQEVVYSLSARRSVVVTDIMKGVSKRALQLYSKCYCVANVTKTFTLKTYKLSIIHHHQWKSHWTVAKTGETRHVMLQYDSSKHCTCPLNKFI
jgi:hypothetical protein